MMKITTLTAYNNPTLAQLAEHLTVDVTYFIGK
jgi:hypothetical protein